MTSLSFAERVIAFNETLQLDIPLPDGIRVMNPFVENPQAMAVSSAFYRKYYNDNNPRRLILGINPGRHGAGVTGIPFTDTKRLAEKCGLNIENLYSHEPSSVFVYEVIEAYGGVEHFYRNFYINSPSPLGFVKANKNGKDVNFNYYDSKELQKLLTDFMVESIKAHVSMGVICDVAFCLGTGKNFTFLKKLNEEHHFFSQLIPLEHPRYIMQYKLKEKGFYVEKYIKALSLFVYSDR